MIMAMDNAFLMEVRDEQRAEFERMREKAGKPGGSRG